MAKSARARSTCAAGALGERLRRVSSWRSSAVSGRRGSVWRRDMGHLGARGSPHHYTTSHGKRPTRRWPERAGALAPMRERAMAYLQQAAVRNRLLSGLTPDGFGLLRPDLEPVALDLRQ